VAVSLSALVWPGAGQVYNRDLKKGFALIALTAGCALVMVVVISRAVIASLPAEMEVLDPFVVQDITRQALLRAGFALNATTFVMTAAWVASVVDAWMVGRRRQSAPAASTISR
jgi:hypothetical protein